MNDSDRRQRYIAQWEAQGVEATRMRIANVAMWPSDAKLWAIEWVATKDQERLSRNEDSISEQILLARAANQIAKQARAVAIAAAIVAIIGAIAAILPFLVR